MPNRTLETSDRVEFRWRLHEEEFARRLVALARQAGRSTPDQAREMLKDILSRPDVLQQAIESLQHDVAQLFQQLQILASLKEILRKLHENIYQLRDDQAASVEKLLVEAGKLTARAAEQWVHETFNAE
jgi:polyhydroxyalkanoate synthesis regulator phasin